MLALVNAFWIGSVSMIFYRGLTNDPEPNRAVEAIMWVGFVLVVLDVCSLI